LQQHCQSTEQHNRPTQPLGQKKKGKPEEPLTQKLQALVVVLGAQLEDLKTSHKTELEDITAELNQAKKEGKSTSLGPTAQRTRLRRS